jgi:putative addiction module component (TIGR02574 family)
MSNQETLLEEALKLPPVERAELIERLLSSFEFRSRKEIDALWAKEAEDRIDAFERGEIEAIPLIMNDNGYKSIEGLSNCNYSANISPSTESTAF